MMVTWARPMRPTLSRKLSTSISASSAFMPLRSRLVPASGADTFLVTVRPLGLSFCFSSKSRRFLTSTRVLIIPAWTKTWPSLGVSSTTALLSRSNISTLSPVLSSLGRV